MLVSYAYIASLDPGTQEGLWGGVPARFLPAYTVAMALATLGYFAYSYFLLFHVDPDRVRIAGRLGYRLFYALYVMILMPSALWLPLTAAMVRQPDNTLWLGIWLALAIVGLGSLVLLLALLTLRPRQPAGAYWLAVVGSVAFCIQTAVLDLFVWTSLFPT